MTWDDCGALKVQHLSLHWPTSACVHRNRISAPLRCKLNMVVRESLFLRQNSRWWVSRYVEPRYHSHSCELEETLRIVRTTARLRERSRSEKGAVLRTRNNKFHKHMHETLHFPWTDHTHWKSNYYSDETLLRTFARLPGLVDRRDLMDSTSPPLTVTQFARTSTGILQISALPKMPHVIDLSGG